MARELTPASDARAAHWIVASLTTFGESVLSVVPEGFEAYVRVFHPAYRHGDRAPDDPALPVSWAEIAEAHGKVAHAGMQMNALTGRELYEGDKPPPELGDWPELGTFPFELAPSLIASLRPHTSTPELCWFAVWDGWGVLDKDALFHQGGAQFEVPAREYHLLHGPIETFAAGVLPSRDFPYGYRSPNLFWPDDRAWCVACEIDFTTTYIGCTDACRTDILATPELEAFPIDPATGLGYASDTINPID